MELALEAMAGLAPKLGELLMAEYVVQKGLKPDIESLSRELVMMNAALVDASRVPPDQLTEVEKLWARQVRELSYDMEDAVDDFTLRVAGGGKSAGTVTEAKLFKKILGKATAAMKKVKDRRQISDKVKDIKKLSNELPRLEELQFVVFTGYWSWEETGVPMEQFPTKDVIEDLDLGLGNLLSLEKVIIEVDCSGATAAEVQEVEAMVTRAAENQPNCPTIQMDRMFEKNILFDEHQEALLQHHIEEHFGVLEWKDKPDAFFISHLRLYRHLQKAVISIDCVGASMCEVENVEAAFRHAAKVHHNHPTIQLIRINADEMVSSTDHPDSELDDDHDDSTDNLLRKLQLRN